MSPSVSRLLPTTPTHEVYSPTKLHSLSDLRIKTDALLQGLNFSCIETLQMRTGASIISHFDIPSLDPFPLEFTWWGGVGEVNGVEVDWGVSLVRWSRWESTGDTGRHRETQTAGVMLERAGVVGSHPGLNIRSHWESWKWW